MKGAEVNDHVINFFLIISIKCVEDLLIMKVDFDIRKPFSSTIFEVKFAEVLLLHLISEIDGILYDFLMASERNFWTYFSAESSWLI